MGVNFFFQIIKPFLFKLDAEKSHNFVFFCLSRLEILLGKFLKTPSPPIVKSTYVRNLFFRNRIGLAAGLDKNGQYIDLLARFGFGSIEIGTVTPEAQLGNEKPRLFRVENERALVNRLGFNNDGMHQVYKNIKKSRWVREKKGILGVNLGINKTTSLTNAYDDYRKGLLCFWDIASYFVINISSPNTMQVRDLQTAGYLEQLVDNIRRLQKQQNEKTHNGRLIFYKISPDNDQKNLARMCLVFNKLDIDGLIVTNTTNDHEGLINSIGEPGGLSGEPLEHRSLSCLKIVRPLLNEEIPIIASGGIMSKEAIKSRLNSGASIVQIYTGLIYEGPKIVFDFLRDS